MNPRRIKNLQPFFCISFLYDVLYYLYREENCAKEAKLPTPRKSSHAGVFNMMYLRTPKNESDLIALGKGGTWGRRAL